MAVVAVVVVVVPVAGESRSSSHPFFSFCCTVGLRCSNADLLGALLGDEAAMLISLLYRWVMLMQSIPLCCTYG